MFLKATIIEAIHITKEEVANKARSERVETKYLVNQKRRIVDQPYYKDMRIRAGVQVNEKAEKVMYLYPADPWLPQNTRIKWEFRGKTFSGTVKFTKSKGASVLGYDKEAYIVSDNE